MCKRFIIFRLILVASVCLGSIELVNGQARKASPRKDDGVATIRGQVAYDKKLIKSWDGNKLIMPFQQIEAKIRQRIVPPPPPYPRDFAKRTPEKRLEWELAFIKTTKGKKFLDDRKKLIEEANAFDVKFEKDGKFVIYDVPYGTYGIQGRTDKEINGKKYAFEVFGEIPVEEGMDEIPLRQMRVEVTPLIQPKEQAPPVKVQTYNNELVMTLDHKSFNDQMVFLNFWYSQTPTAAVEQKMIQEMYAKLKDEHPIKLVSICVDDDRDKAVAFMRKHSLKLGSHGFTDGFDHRTIFDYGVRSYPSFWLIGPDRKVMMTQYETAAAMRIKPDMKTIVEDRILGKDQPTLAKPPEEGKQPTPAKKAG